jgi:drug/metabolite transporter (DMT)-like permease
VRAVLPWLAVSILLGSVGQFLLKLAAQQLGQLSLAPASLARLALSPFVWAGVVLFASSMVLWIKVLTAAPLATAYPLVSLSYVVVLLLSWAFLGEPITGLKVAGIVAIMLGVALLTRA